ncbi:hypothetical protein BCR36DRAFT_217885, partial [Piromyces finnis]
INDLYKDLLDQNISEDIEKEKSKHDKLELNIKLNNIKVKLCFDEIVKISKFNGIMMDLIVAQINIINDIKLQTIKSGISLLSIEPEELQIEPLFFITPSYEFNFLSIVVNNNISNNIDPNAFLNEFLDNHSLNDYGKFWFKEKSLKQAKTQIHGNINKVYLNINPDIIKGVIHIINYVLDLFINVSSKDVETRNSNNEINSRESSLVYDSFNNSPIEKMFELLTINIKINDIIISLYSYDDIFYQISLGTFESFIALSNLG